MYMSASTHMKDPKLKLTKWQLDRLVYKLD